jgi:hypothetical protein
MSIGHTIKITVDDGFFGLEGFEIESEKDEDEMKPTSEMTDQELNQAIGILKGWKNYDWSSKYTLPDYCNSWEHAGGLLEEMAKPNLRPSLFYCDNFKWTCNISILEPEGRYFEHKVSIRNCVFPTRAIAEAWYEVFHDEK